jgi:hypothetical protein
MPVPRLLGKMQKGTDRPPPRKKRETIIINNNKKDM